MSEERRKRRKKLLSIVMINKHTIIENMCLLINNISPLCMNGSHVSSISDVFVNCDECRFINEALRAPNISLHRQLVSKGPRLISFFAAFSAPPASRLIRKKYKNFQKAARNF
jgi:hypothetical protein